MSFQHCTTPLLQDALSLEVDFNGDAEVVIDPILDSIGMGKNLLEVFPNMLSVSMETLPRSTGNAGLGENAQKACLQEDGYGNATCLQLVLTRPTSDPIITQGSNLIKEESLRHLAH